MDYAKIERIATAGGKHADITYVAIAQGAAGTTALKAAITSKRHKVLALFVVMDTAAATFKFTDDSGDLSGAVPCAQYGGIVLTGTGYPYMQTGISAGLNIVTVGGKANGTVVILTEAD